MNPYDVLGIPNDAKPEQIRRAYILRTKMLHPDRFDQTSEWAEWDLANEMLKELNHAYVVLDDAASRASYDSADSWQQSGTSRNKAPSPTPNRPATPDIQLRPKRWGDRFGAKLASASEHLLNRALSRCENCKYWWSQGDEISRTELGREPGWTNVMRSQTTYRQDRDPAHTYVTEWQETIPIVRIYCRITYRCRRCHYTHSGDVEHVDFA